MTRQRITIVGATSGPGKSMLLKLAKRNYDVVGIGRNPEKVNLVRRSLLGTRGVIRQVDVSKNRSFLETTDVLVHCSHPALATTLMSDNLSCFIGLGSTRKFTRFPDQRSRDVTTMEQRAMSLDLPTTILHPTLIYGAEGFSNVERIIRMGQRFPLIPLPRGGSSLIQPIHCDDVATALINCLDNHKVVNRSIVIAGLSPMTYRTFVQKTLDAMNLSARVISLPSFMIKTLAACTRVLPGVPAIRSDEVARLLEDKNFDTLEMQQLLALIPREYDEGIRQYAAAMKTRGRF